jgi:MtN3 and saliva related transmembrane protein
MNIIAILATIFGTIGGFSSIPQVYKIFKRKSAKDISIMTYAIVLLGTISWLLYGIQLKDFPLIFSNSVALIFVSLVILGWFLYGYDKKKK